jgi:methyl acetate hydrolase
MSNFDRILQEGVAAGAAPGASATVVDHSGVRWEGAAGERVLGSNVAMTIDTVGAIHSMTKAITGAAAMQLVEQGKLSLDSPASEVIPWLGEVQVLSGFDTDSQPQTRPPKTPVTLRQLLTHTSGFVYEIWNENDVRWRQATETPSLFSLKNAALRAPLAFDPGTRWEYGTGIDWTGKMVEAASGLTLGSYFEQNLTGPLGMKDTAFSHTPSMLERTAGLHTREKNGALVCAEPNEPAKPEYEMGGGGLHSTMSDYGRFIRMMLNRGTLEGEQLLKETTVAEMVTNQIGDLRACPLKTAAPAYSNDAEFFPGEPKSWGLTFQINETPCETGRPAGTLMWAGLANSFFWIDMEAGVGGSYLSQILPFGDSRSLDLFFEIEREVYRQAR